ncbi:MAG: cupin domain-containing protein [Burkholderiales bacterium]|nr:cupin domain-containing protein [Burkholderiales bacterium]
MTHDFRMSSPAQDQLMHGRVARYADLVPLPVQRDASIPLPALDLIYARKLLPVIGLVGGGDTPISSSAPVQGAAGITMTYAACPPGQGPGLHTHKATYETFIVMQGEFEITWGDAGEYRTVLKEKDVVSIPPGISRAFRNVGSTEAVLLVVISGGENNMADIHLPAKQVDALKATSPELLERVVSAGMTYDKTTA